MSMAGASESTASCMPCHDCVNGRITDKSLSKREVASGTQRRIIRRIIWWGFICIIPLLYYHIGCLAREGKRNSGSESWPWSGCCQQMTAATRTSAATSAMATMANKDIILPLFIDATGQQQKTDTSFMTESAIGLNNSPGGEECVCGASDSIAKI